LDFELDNVIGSPTLGFQKSSGLSYHVGEALAVHGHNDSDQCREFIEWYGLHETDLVLIKLKNTKKNGKDRNTEQHQKVRTVIHIFTQYLDIFGRPTKRFYQNLAQYATDIEQKNKLEWFASKEGADEFKQRVDESLTYADILREFPSAHPSLPELMDLVPEILPRHYSIASSMKAHPNSVHLLIVTNDWTTPTGKYRIGQCTRYLQNIRVGQKLVASIKPSVMVLPTDHSQPLVMAGLGTGMAPFRAFIQERAHLKSQGVEVGPMALYFGARTRFAEYLYGEEMEAYHRSGLLTHLQLAFSRDQLNKIYIQHKILEDRKIMVDFLDGKEGTFYLCGPTWPAGDVQDAITRAFNEVAGLSAEESQEKIKKMKKEGRYILEVY